MPGKRLLSGVRVVEMGTMITAPYAAMILAELGAEVIKVERPGGDPFRGFRKGGGPSPQFSAFNKQKKSVVLDLANAADMQTFSGLLARSDVLIENVRPGVLTRLGLGPERLETEFPDLVHCSITGFGASGPYKARPAFDTVGQALAGLLGLFVDGDNPRIAGPTVSDNVTGLYAAVAILGALLAKSRGETVRRIEVDMLSASVAFSPDLFIDFLNSGRSQTPYSRVASSQSYVLRCGDGKLIALHLSSPDKFWQGLVAAMEEPSLASDARFAGREDRIANYQALRAVLGEISLRQPRAYWMARLEANDVPFAPVYNAAEVVADEQVRHLGLFGEAVGGGEGTAPVVASPIVFDGNRRTGFSAPPALDGDREEIEGIAVAAGERRSRA